LNYFVVLGGGFALHGLHLQLFLLNYFVVRVGALFCFPQIASAAIYIELLRSSRWWVCFARFASAAILIELLRSSGWCIALFPTDCICGYSCWGTS